MWPSTIAEILKLRRSLPLVLAIIAPVAVIAVQWPVFLGMSNPKAYRGFWSLWLNQVLTFWALIILPCLIALTSASITSVEHQNKNWKYLFVVPQARWKIYFAKILVCAGLIAISTCGLAFLTLLTGVALGSFRPAFEMPISAIPWRTAFSTAGMMYLASWFQISVIMWISLRFASFAAPVATGVVGMATGIVLVRSEVSAQWFPWLWPMDVAAYQQKHLLWAVVFGMIGGLLISALACRNARRREC